MSKQYKSAESLELEQIEYIKSKLGDREWRLDNLYHIKDKQGRLLKFVRNEAQLEFWSNMWWRNVILKDRQRGFSTFIAIFFLDHCLFNSNTNAGIIDITLPDAQKKLDKVKVAYDHLPEWLKNTVPMVERAKTGILLGNGSRIDVGISYRGDTLQLLHVSELGKIAMRFPDRATEIKTGALNTVHEGSFVFFESTAEGSSGYFYDTCRVAQEMQERGEKLTWKDFKFHFFGWWMGSDNEMDPAGIFIPGEVEKYCRELETQLGFKISDRKRAWYAKTWQTQGDQMTREFPGTADEAFMAAIEGVILAKQMRKLRKAGAITVVPIEVGIPVQTGWDWGLNDMCTIWLHQRVGFQDRLIGYMQGDDEDVLWYWRELNREYSDVVWGNHFLPHDMGYRRAGSARTAEEDPKTLEMILNGAGMRNTHVVPKLSVKATGHQEVRNWLPSAIVDEKRCEDGLKCLNHYRKQRTDDDKGWKDKPVHDWASNGYDGLESLVRGLNWIGPMTQAASARGRRKRASSWRTV